MNAFDKCIVAAVKPNKFVYDSKLYTKCAKERKIFFRNLAKALSKKFSKKHTETKVSQRWKKLRDYYLQACRDKENDECSSPIVAAVSEECSFLDGYVGKNHAEQASDTTFVREESDAPNSEDEENSGGNGTESDAVDSEREEEETMSLECMVEQGQRTATTSENSVEGLINPDFPKKKTQSITKAPEVSPIVDQCLKRLEDIIEKGKSVDKVKARAQIVSKFLDDLPKEKQPACLQQLLKVFIKYE